MYCEIFFTFGITLQVGAAHVERNVGTVDHPVEQSEEVGHNVLYRIGDKHLIAEELNLVAMDLEVVLDLREVEHTRQVEGVVHIEVNPEERLILHGIELAVESFDSPRR